MQLQISSKFKTFRAALESSTASISTSFIFAIDSLSLVLFALVILGIADHLPAFINTVVQVAFIAITTGLLLLFCFRRIFPLALLKISMLFLLYVVDVSVYFV